MSIQILEHLMEITALSKEDQQAHRTLQYQGID